MPRDVNSKATGTPSAQFFQVAFLRLAILQPRDEVVGAASRQGSQARCGEGHEGDLRQARVVDVLADEQYDVPAVVIRREPVGYLRVLRSVQVLALDPREVVRCLR